MINKNNECCLMKTIISRLKLTFNIHQTKIPATLNAEGKCRIISAGFNFQLHKKGRLAGETIEECFIKLKERFISSENDISSVHEHYDKATIDSKRMTNIIVSRRFMKFQCLGIHTGENAQLCKRQ